MIGIILTGHGYFATGINSDIELVAGQQEKFKVIDFEQGMTPDKLEELFKNSIDELGIEDGIVFMTDIAGGTPFNKAVTLKEKKQNIEVIAGVNVPLILESLFNRELSVDKFVKMAVELGKSSLTLFRLRKKQEIQSSEGI